jgi:hypothetical protein
MVPPHPDVVPFSLKIFWLLLHLPCRMSFHAHLFAAAGTCCVPTVAPERGLCFAVWFPVALELVDLQLRPGSALFPWWGADHFLTRSCLNLTKESAIRLRDSHFHSLPRRYWTLRPTVPDVVRHLVSLEQVGQVKSVDVSPSRTGS